MSNEHTFNCYTPSAYRAIERGDQRHLINIKLYVGPETLEALEQSEDACRDYGTICADLLHRYAAGMLQGASSASA